MRLRSIPRISLGPAADRRALPERACACDRRYCLRTGARFRILLHDLSESVCDCAGLGRFDVESIHPLTQRIDRPRAVPDVILSQPADVYRGGSGNSVLVQAKCQARESIRSRPASSATGRRGCPRERRPGVNRYGASWCVLRCRPTEWLRRGLHLGLPELLRGLCAIVQLCGARLTVWQSSQLERAQR